jgi:hypothetical protein
MQTTNFQTRYIDLLLTELSRNPRNFKLLHLRERCLSTREISTNTASYEEISFKHPNVKFQGQAVALLVEVLLYKPEGRGFKSR